MLFAFGGTVTSSGLISTQTGSSFSRFGAGFFALEDVARKLNEGPSTSKQIA